MNYKDDALSKGHKETDPLYSRYIFCKGLNFLMMKQIHVFLANLWEIIFSFNFHRFCLYPVSVLPVGAVCGYLAEVDLRVEIGGERINCTSSPGHPHSNPHD